MNLAKVGEPRIMLCLNRARMVDWSTVFILQGNPGLSASNVQGGCHFLVEYAIIKL